MSKVTNMDSMFNAATSFNQNLSTRDVSNVEDMGGLFSNALAFNGDISNWNTSKAKRMFGMFEYARSFTGDVSAWDFTKINNPSLPNQAGFTIRAPGKDRYWYPSESYKKILQAIKVAYTAGTLNFSKFRIL